MVMSEADERSGVRDGHPYSTAVVRRSMKRATVHPRLAYLGSLALWRVCTRRRRMLRRGLATVVRF